MSDRVSRPRLCSFHLGGDMVGCLAHLTTCFLGGSPPTQGALKIEAGRALTRPCLFVFLRHSYSPRQPAALSAHSCPRWIYRRTMATERWRVWSMMLLSLAPALAAAVAMPDRSEWPA